jgi:TonB dependent receptor/TonB-dependent Receptor Plug Domain
MSLRKRAVRHVAQFAVLAWIGVPLVGLSMAAAQTQDPDRFQGRSLTSALSKLQERGLKVIFSSELVRSNMIVLEEPRARGLAEILEELLAPHGLRSTPGPSGALLVVKAPAAPKAPLRGATDKRPSGAPQKPAVPHLYQEHVDVRGGDPDARRDLPVVWETIGTDQLRTSPEYAADPLLPVARAAGVAASDGSGGLNVRGGATRETKIILDGLELYEPYHLKDRGGPVSILDSQNVGEVGLLSGGFPAEYGGYMSAVVEMDTVAASDDLETTAAVSSGDIRLGARGPLGPNVDWLVSARHGNPSRLLDALGADPAYRPPFSDFFLKADQRLNDSTILSLRVLGADDEAEGGGTDEVLETIRERGTLRSQHTQRYAWMMLQRAFSSRLAARTVLSAGQLTSDRYGSSERVSDLQDARSTRLLGVKQDWLRQSGSHLFKWGLDFKHLRARYNYTSVPTDATPVAIASAPSGDEVGVYVADRLRVSPALTVEVGVRWDRQTYTPDPDGMLSPRVNAVHAVGRRGTVRVGWGYFYQPRKIHELQVEDGVDRFFPAERAEHRVISYEHALDGGVILLLTGYQKHMSDLNPRFENAVNPLSFFPEANRDRIKIAPEAARAEGLELVARRRVARTTGWWAAYSLARAEDDIDGRWIPRQWDRRHALSVGVEWRPTRRWDVVLASSHHSGRPLTPVTMEGTLGARNSLRSTGSHRVDMRISRSISIRDSDLVASLTLTDAFGDDRPCCVAEIDRLMTFGLAWRF